MANFLIYQSDITSQFVLKLCMIEFLSIFPRKKLEIIHKKSFILNNKISSETCITVNNKMGNVSYCGNCYIGNYFFIIISKYHISKHDITLNNKINFHENDTFL